MDERVIYKNCPLCESANFAFLRSGDCSVHPGYDPRLSAVINWNRCADCGHVFTEGYYTGEACEIIFATIPPNQNVGADPELNRMHAARMVEKILPFASEGVWLDVGFGNGALLFTAQEYGFKPVGTDLRRDSVALMNALGIVAHNKGIAELHLEEKCAIISMADVLEHIPFPKTALAAAHRLMVDDGILLISMPNMETMLWNQLDQQNKNPYWGEMEHCHNFSRTRLYALLAECGFEAKRYGISLRYRACMEVIAQKK